MNVTFYEAECLEEITVPELGRCEIGTFYKLNQWQAMYWGAAFDIKGARKKWSERVKMDDKSQGEVEEEIAKKERAEAARQAALAKATDVVNKVKEVVIPRAQEVMAMAAGKINDLIAKYRLPKQKTKDENAKLVIKYEEAYETTKAVGPEERLALLEALEIEKPEDGEFDEVSEITYAVVMGKPYEAPVSKKAPKIDPKDKKAK